MTAGNYVAMAVHSKCSGRMVGFSVYNLFVITDNDYINVKELKEYLF